MLKGVLRGPWSVPREKWWILRLLRPFGYFDAAQYKFAQDKFFLIFVDKGVGIGRILSLVD
jgi:hypothetical protein